MNGYAHPEVLVETDWVKANLGKPGIKLVEIDVNTSAYECAVSKRPSNFCNEATTSLWRRSPPTPASRTRASSPIIASASSASRRGSSGCPQESPKRPQVPSRNRRATPLAFRVSRLGRRGRLRVRAEAPAPGFDTSQMDDREEESRA